MDKDLGIIDAALSHVFIPFRFGAMILCMHADEDASAWAQTPAKVEYTLRDSQLFIAFMILPAREWKPLCESWLLSYFQTVFHLKVSKK